MSNPISNSVSSFQSSPYYPYATAIMAGGVTPFVTQPVWAAKNAFQTGRVQDLWKGNFQKTVASVYSGVGVQSGAYGFVFSAQSGAASVVQKVLCGDEIPESWQQITAATASGILTADLAAVVENSVVQIKQYVDQARDEKRAVPSNFQVVKDVYEKHGISAFRKGVFYIRGREMFFVPAFKVVPQLASEQFQKQGVNKEVADFAGGAFGGAVGGYCSNVFDMNAANARVGKPASWTMQNIVKGPGAVPRAVFCALAVGTYTVAEESIKEVFNKVVKQ